MRIGEDATRWLCRVLGGSVDVEAYTLSRMPSRLGRLRPSRRFIAFFFGSGAGLLVDLGGFSLLIALGVAPGIANLCSSFASISVVYALVTRYSFGVGTKPSTYVIFVAWYSLAIIVFSTLIEWAVVTTGFLPIVCKLASVPFSFSLNYAFSRLLFRRR